VAFDRCVYRAAARRDLLSHHRARRRDGRVELRALVDTRVIRRDVEVEDRASRVAEFGRQRLDAVAELLLADVARAPPRRRVAIARRDHVDAGGTWTTRPSAL
jgi:hypothetical protein